MRSKIPFFLQAPRGALRRDRAVGPVRGAVPDPPELDVEAAARAAVARAVRARRRGGAVLRGGDGDGERERGQGDGRGGQMRTRGGAQSPSDPCFESHVRRGGC